nr:MAG TPA: hypothetical protein [Caudoviricetes sp.]
MNLKFQPTLTILILIRQFVHLSNTSPVIRAFLSPYR